MSLYRNILGQAWKVTWRRKYLWFFGLFAALLGNGGEYEILMKGLGDDTAQNTFSLFNRFKETGIFSARALGNIADIARDDTSSFIITVLAALAVLALVLFLLWLSVASQAALVNNAAGHLGGKDGDIKDGLAAGMKNFWPVLALNAVLKAAVYAILMIFGLPAVYAAAGSGAIAAPAVYVLAFIVFMVLVLTLSFIIKYSIGFTVIKGQNLGEAMKSGWKLFMGNWVISLEMAFILFFASLIVSFAYFLLVLVFAAPFAFLALVFSKLSASGFMLIMFLALAFYMVSLAFVGAILSAFQISSWTALFVRLTGKGGESKIARIVNGLLDR